MKMMRRTMMIKTTNFIWKMMIERLSKMKKIYLDIYNSDDDSYVLKLIKM